MHLTRFSDYSLRLLLYAASMDDRLITIEEVAHAYGISRAHLMKVANLLVRTGYLVSVRGRSGGLRLSRPAADINLGAILRATEPDFALVECMSSKNGCAITAKCRLKCVLHSALAAFLAELDAHTLADLELDPRDFGLVLPPD
ncbi:Rrf2 family transcriptional regulator [Pelagibacterium limicola]|uniref:Rrf2 family transcriptional regulator n=1 Tax=Pelagibacterium limicola TaxID=2791022 RepID=UPI0018AF89AE|nr:Rrf2 family transcriptional regulator [Pelagibacterium limicola]